MTYDAEPCTVCGGASYDVWCYVCTNELCFNCAECDGGENACPDCSIENDEDELL